MRLLVQRVTEASVSINSKVVGSIEHGFLVLIGIAQEDDEGHIAGLRGSDASLEILVVMPDGQDWFPRALFYDHFATTGLNIHR